MHAWLWYRVFITLQLQLANCIVMVAAHKVYNEILEEWSKDPTQEMYFRVDSPTCMQIVLYQNYI